MRFLASFQYSQGVGTGLEKQNNMANRRMFSLKVVDTDAFLDMPQSSQLLYYSLAMRADDDGFIANSKKIMRMLGSQDDDFKVLVAKKFIIPFESGVCVIKHWLIHNLIRGDRYTETQWIKEKNQLVIEEGTNKYSLKSGMQNVIPSDTPGKVRLGEDRLDKIKNTYGEFNNVLLKEEEYQKLIDNLGETNTKILIEELSSYMASKGKRYSSHYATIQTWARRRVQNHQEKLQNKKRTII